MQDLKEWLTPPIVWFATGFVLLLFEFIHPGVILIFFGIGAWLVATLCLFIDISINLQLVIFLISSITLLFSLRNKFKTLFQKRIEPDQDADEQMEEFLGKKAVVTQEITPMANGKVEFRGTYWEAESSAAIAEETPVEIIGKNNITLVVRPL